jgi:hypothetical protein
MSRTRAFLFAVATAVAVAGAVSACSGDDVVGATPGTDGGTDGTAPPMDSGTDTAPPGDAGDGGDAGPCDFNTFVIGLIQNHTNSTDQPSIDLGQNCVDTHTPFPSTVFQ